MRDEGGDLIRLDLVGPDGIIGSINVKRSVLPLLAQRLLEAGLRAPQIAQERVEASQRPNGAENGEWPSDAVRVAYQAYRAGREEAMTREKFKDLFKRKGKKGRHA